MDKQTKYRVQVCVTARPGKKDYWMTVAVFNDYVDAEIVRRTSTCKWLRSRVQASDKSW